jgi:hypothetical protein
MSDTVRCPNCERAIPPAMLIYTYIRLRCECGAGVVLVRDTLADSISAQACVITRSDGGRHSARPAA